MEFMESGQFLEKCDRSMYYVGFLKSSEQWFPLCILRDPEESESLDTLLFSVSYQEMMRVVDEYAKKIPLIEGKFVQYLFKEEIANLLSRYALTNTAFLEPEEGSEGCGCGCGCG